MVCTDLETSLETLKMYASVYVCMYVCVCVYIYIHMLVIHSHTTLHGPQKLREMLRDSEDARAKLMQENDELLVSLDRCMRRQKDLEVCDTCMRIQTYARTHTHTCIVLYVCVCVCVHTHTSLSAWIVV
jgi:hypothetical protein